MRSAIGLGVLSGLLMVSVSGQSEEIFSSGSYLPGSLDSASFQSLGFSTAFGTEFEIGLEFDLAAPVSLNEFSGALVNYSGAPQTVSARVVRVGRDGTLGDTVIAPTPVVAGPGFAGTPFSFASGRTAGVLQTGRYAVLLTDPGDTGVQVLGEPTVPTNNPFSLFIPGGGRVNQAADVSFQFYGTSFDALTSGVRVAGPEGFAGARVINFDGDGSTALPVEPGVTFLRTSPRFDGSDRSFGGTTLFGVELFGDQFWSNLSTGDSPNGFTDLGMAFDTPVDSLSFTALSLGIANELTLRVLAEDDTLVYEEVLSIASGATTERLPLFVGLEFDTPVSRFELLGADTGAGFVGVDNVAFTSVPEPASALLILLGGTVLTACRRA